MADEYLTVDCPMVLCDATAGEPCPNDSGKPHCMRWVAVTSPEKARAFCEQQARDQLAIYRNDGPALTAMAADSEHPLAEYATRILALIPRLAAALAGTCGDCNVPADCAVWGRCANESLPPVDEKEEVPNA